MQATPDAGATVYYYIGYSAVLALSDGRPRDASALVYVSGTGTELPNRAARALLVHVEALEFLPGIDELAEHVIALIVSRVNDAPAPHAAARINDAFVAANELVRQSQARSTRRSLLGVTAAIAVGHELLVAHVPPGQVIVRQGQTLFAYPEIASWGLPAPIIDAPLARPLGLHAQTEPALLFTQYAAGDVLCVLSGSSATVVDRDRNTLLRAANADDFLTTIGARYDSARLRDGTVAVLAIAASRRKPTMTTQLGHGVTAPGDRRSSSPNRRKLTHTALDPEAPTGQTESAQGESGNHAHNAPNFTGSTVARTAPEAADRTDELPLLELRHAAE